MACSTILPVGPQLLVEAPLVWMGHVHPRVIARRCPGEQAGVSVARRARHATLGGRWVTGHVARERSAVHLVAGALPRFLGMVIQLVETVASVVQAVLVG